MHNHAGTQFDGRQHVVADDADAADAAIAAAGFTPPPRFGAGRNAVCGAAERVSVRDVLENEHLQKSFLPRVCTLVATGIPLNLSPHDFPCKGPGIDSWQRFCELIQSALSSHGLSGRSIGLCMHSHQMPLEAYCLIADVVLGRGPRYVFLDSLQMQPHGSDEVVQRAEANWLFLWRQRSADRPVMPVYGGLVRSACPLLADEVAAAVLPGRGLHCPLDSAWLPIVLPLTNFATPAGKIRWRRLRSAIREVLVVVEQRFDQLDWPAPAQQNDARKNRRLAFEVTEIGDLVMRRGDDPGSLASLEWAAKTVGRIRSELRRESARIAAEFGAIPALAEANHVDQWTAGPHRDSWSRHWNNALRRSAVRYRNLLVISPYSVVPDDAASTAGFADLLPVIGLADAWTFAEPADFRGWSVAQFRHFHCRARATIQRSHTASFVAAGV